MRAFDAGIDRKSGDRDFEKRYFIAAEGFTELQYLSAIKRFGSDPRIGIPGNIDIQLLDRFDQDSGVSNPKIIVTMMDEYRELIRTGEYSASLFASTIVQQIFDDMAGPRIGAFLTSFKRSLRHLQKTMIKELKESDYCEDGKVIGECWEDATELCKGLIEGTEFKDEARHIRIPKDRRMDSFYNETHIFCLVADRDLKSNPRAQYLQLLSDCKRHGFRLFISNPCFEFWLLLHDASSLRYRGEETDLIQSDDPCSGCRFAEKELISLHGSYDKTDIRFEERYLDHVQDAIEHAESFSTGLEDLESHIGSNVGILIEEMRSGRK